MSKDFSTGKNSEETTTNAYIQAGLGVFDQTANRGGLVSLLQPKLRGPINNNISEQQSSTSTQLPEEVQAKMETSFGQDFSGVNIHKDSSSAQDINAKAYTQGTDVHFAPGEYNPQSKEGQELIGHELTHVVQQGQGKVGSGEVHGKGLEVNQDATLEKEADEAGRLASEGRSVEVSGISELTVQKKDDKKTGSKTDTSSLTKEERSELLRITGDRIGNAYTDYVDAANMVKYEMAKAIESERDMAVAIAEIALGYLLPGASKALAAWADKIPSTASNAKFLLAYSLVDASVTQQLFATAGKLATTELKINYKNLTSFGNIEVFIGHLKSETRKAFDQFNIGLVNLSDMQLATTFLAFHPDLTNASTYSEQIRSTVNRFKEQVLTIGKKGVRDDGTNGPNSRAYISQGVAWVEIEPNRYVLCNFEASNKSGESTHMVFKTFIDKDMGRMATKAQKLSSGTIQELTFDKLELMRQYNLIRNFPQTIPKGKYYEENK